MSQTNGLGPKHCHKPKGYGLNTVTNQRVMALTLLQTKGLGPKHCHKPKDYGLNTVTNKRIRA